MQQIEKSKRKNDEEKPKRGVLGGLSDRKLFFLILCAAFGMGLFIFLSVETGPDPLPPFPSARLVYSTDAWRFALDLRTGQRTPLPSEPIFPEIAMAPVYSPDGKWAVNWAGSSKRWHLVIRDISTSPETVRRVGEGLFYSASLSLSWSPDSQLVVFNATPDGEQGAEIWSLHTASGVIQRLTDDHNGYTKPDFSPDGLFIVYASQIGDSGLYLMDITTHEAHILSDIDGHNPVWSPDGLWIAFCSTPSSYLHRQNDVWLIRPDGTGKQTIAKSPRFDCHLEWLP